MSDQKQQQVYMIATGTPNGNILTSGPAICYTADGGLWVKTDVSYSNTGWVEFLAELT